MYARVGGKFKVEVEIGLDQSTEGADLHIAKIDALYRDVRSEEKYKSSPELIRLGIAIVQAQYPEFF